MEIDKLRLINEIFSGRTDAYGENSGPCVKEPLTDEMIDKHLTGKVRVGRFPLSPDILDGSGTWWIAADIDDDEIDVAVQFTYAMAGIDIPCYIERSKSKGFHVWVFFSEPVEAKWARALMNYGIKVVADDLKYQIYELFPKQDSIKHNDGTYGFGNYINLPLFGGNLDKNRTVFLNPDNEYRHFTDQWGFLQSIRKVTPQEIADLIEMGEILEPPENITNPKQKVSTAENTLNPSSMLSVMMEKCAFCREFMPDTGEIHEELWYMWLTQMVCFEGGAELAFELSSGSPKFDEKITQAKIKHAQEALADKRAPYTCEKIIGCQGWQSDDCLKCLASPTKRNASPAGMPYILKGLEAEKAKVLPKTSESSMPEAINEAQFLPTFTEGWLSRKFVELHGHAIRYCYDWDKWIVWTERQWRIDKSGEVYHRAKDVIKNLLKQASETDDDKVRKLLSSFAHKSDTRGKYSAIVELAKCELPILPSEFDTDPMLFNCFNGTVDLRTGELRPTRREDFITKLSLIDFNPNAKAPRWERFLKEIFKDNEGIIEFLQRAVGYSLTGEIREQVLLVLYGKGANGKTTFLETLLNVFGDYGKQSESDLLIVKKHEQHPCGVADLMGARFVTAMEVGEGKRLNETLVKRLTGKDTLKARFMRQDFFSFEPTHKIFMAVNHKPHIRGTDTGIWRRIRLIPFDIEIPEQKQDQQLQDKLLKEASGILAWAVRGCLAWQEQGLDITTEIEKATNEYRDDMDTIGAFIADCCVENPNYKVKVSELYQHYREWCEQNGERYLSRKEMGADLLDRGHERKRLKNGYHYFGIGILEDELF